jgi:hypothetical protein
LTFYYWDDWMLSGHLFPQGETLTLGVAGASGPRQLAQTDPRHRQTGVDLFAPAGAMPPLEFHLGSATDYIRATGRAFDSIWIDLYRSALPEFEVLEAGFLSALEERLRPGGLVCIHLFRPANCFFRYDRASDPFEPLLARHLGALGLRASVLDHYSSQTWIIGRSSDAALAARLAKDPRSSSGLLRRWLPYARAILREVPIERPEIVPVNDLKAAFVAPVGDAALGRIGLDFCRNAGDWDALLGSPLALMKHHQDLGPGRAGDLILETLALWTTAPGLALPQRTRLYLQEIARSRAETGLPEFEVRRSLLS